MKNLAAYSQQLGDKGSVQGSIGVDGDDLVAQVKVDYRQPIAAIVNKIMPPIDALVDKLEALIPGDQKTMAAAAKSDVRAAIVKALSEAASPAPAPAALPESEV